MSKKSLRKTAESKGRKTTGTFRITRPRKTEKREITRDEFHALVRKSAQPIEDTSVSDEASDKT
jgi:hypothetical protein